MAKQIEVLTLTISAVVTDADPDNWVVNLVHEQHKVGESTAAGATYPSSGIVESETLSGDQKGAKDTSGTLLKYFQDKLAAVETLEGI